jgi:hypothetical protein
MQKDNKNYQGHLSATSFTISQNLWVWASQPNICHLELNLFCNVKTKFMFLLKGMKATMSEVCFKVLVSN